MIIRVPVSVFGASLRRHSGGLSWDAIKRRRIHIYHCTTATHNRTHLHTNTHRVHYVVGKIRALTQPNFHTPHHTRTRTHNAHGNARTRALLKSTQQHKTHPPVPPLCTYIYATTQRGRTVQEHHRRRSANKCTAHNTHAHSHMYIRTRAHARTHAHTDTLLT